MGYKIHTFKGISWAGLLRASTRGITFIRLAILARILNPTQFGVFGIATLILSFLEIITETGINVFLVQEKGDIKKYISSAWAVSIIRGAIIALFLFCLAPFISEFFHSEESTSLIRLIAIVPLIRGFLNPSIINVQKNIEFHKEFYLRSSLFLIDSSVAVITAFITRSAISFVFGLIASAVFEVLFSYIFFRPYPTFSFEIKLIKHIIRRGWWVTATGIFLFFADNGDNAVVGKLLGINSLGVYQVAYKLSTLPISEITDTVNKVIFPVYSKFSEDRERLFRAFSKVALVTTILAGILGIMVFLFAKEIVIIVVGEQWLIAVPAIKILALYGVLRTIFGNFAPMALSVNKQDYVAKSTLLRLVGLGITIVPLSLKYGLSGAAISVLISIFFEIPLILYYLFVIFKQPQIAAAER